MGCRVQETSVDPREARSRDNAAVAAWLRQAAEILQAQGAGAFRVAAYRKAAQSIESFAGDVRASFEAHGREGLQALPGIGPRLAGAIAEMLETGRWIQLERLRGSLDAQTLFRTVPGIGPELAQRIHDTLGVDTLVALEVAAHDGTLDAVPGVGTRRAAAIRASLAEILDRGRLRYSPVSVEQEPPVAMLLDVDRQYREQAGKGELATIAPRRFNPAHEAWLPVLHASRDDWHVTALFSNTARAHELRRTRDWVVLYFDHDRRAERQRTVVTEQRGALAGRRVVRGREAECAALYGVGSAKAAC